MSQDAPQQLLVDLRLLDRRCAQLDANELDESRGQIAYWKDEVRNTGPNRAARHGRVFGLLRVLYQDNATCFLDGTHPNGTVRTGAAENDRKAVAHALRDGAEEQVNRCPLST